MLSWLISEKVDHPLANAKDATRIVDEFPFKDPQKCVEDASYWITSVNETPELRWDKRYEVLSLLDAATRKSQEQLLAAYVTLPDNDRTQEKRLWKICSDFWGALGTGYQACVDQAAQPIAVTDALKSHTPALAARALRALRQQLKWVLMRYSIVRTGIWQDVARCEAFAEAQGVITTPVAVYAGNDNSPCDESLRAMMLWAASLSGLSPVEQDVAERIVAALTPKFKFAAQAWDGCDYCFDLDGARPPLRLTRSTPVFGATRYFDGTEAHQALQTMFITLSTTGDMPRGFDPGSVADLALIGRVLRHLQINWAKGMPSRAHERRRTAASLSVVHVFLRERVAHAQSGRRRRARFCAPGAARIMGGRERHRGLLRRGGARGARRMVASGYAAGAAHRDQFGLEPGCKKPREGRRTPPAPLLRAIDFHVPGRIDAAHAGGGRPRPKGAWRATAVRTVVAQWQSACGREPRYADRARGAGGLLWKAVTVQFDAGGVVESGHDFDWLRYKLLASLT